MTYLQIWFIPGVSPLDKLAAYDAAAGVVGRKIFTAARSGSGLAQRLFDMEFERQVVAMQPEEYKCPDAA
jgi:hypothetical protein